MVLERRLRQALVHLNPDLPPEAPEDAWRKLTRVDAPPACAADRSLVERNRAVHRTPVDDITRLPRPISGELRVKHAEKFIERAV
jgi:type I restriction enzyme R subunit